MFVYKQPYGTILCLVQYGGFYNKDFFEKFSIAFMEWPPLPHLIDENSKKPQKHKAMKKFIFAALIATASFNAYSQEVGISEYNEHSVRPVREADVMLKNTVWVRMDLRTKANEPFFAQDKEITKILVQAVKDGLLKPYTSDKMDERMALATFLENLQMPTGAGEAECCGYSDAWTEGDSWPKEDDTWIAADTGPEARTPAAPVEFFPKQMTSLVLKIDQLYDRKHSRPVNDIQTISIIIPGENYPTGIDKEIAVFSYKEVVEHVFRDNPDAVWFNPRNMAEHRNLEEAFDLSMYEGRIIKFANPQGQYIDDIYTDLKKALGVALEMEHRQVEAISNLYAN
jgi:gliding motility associated protien GldN